MFDGPVTILSLHDNSVNVEVVANKDGSVVINTVFAGREISGGRIYKSPSQAMSDARVIFYLLNGLDELLMVD